MTLPRLYELAERWNFHPPIHRLLAAFMGVGKKKENEGSLEDLMAEVSAITGKEVRL